MYIYVWVCVCAFKRSTDATARREASELQSRSKVMKAAEGRVAQAKNLGDQRALLGA